jgi:hypothetical protein
MAIAYPKYNATEISARIPLVIPAEAGIQAVFWIPAKSMPE